MRGLGIDLVLTSRFKKVKKDDYARWRRVFYPSEWQYAFRSKGSANRLAGIFSVKEAAMKAYGNAGLTHFLDWELNHDRSGAPKISFLGKSKKQPKALVSISHDGDYAIAVVLIQ